jgi:type IV pilus assembly protein PilB
MRLCVYVRSHPENDVLAARHSVPGARFHHGTGCPACNGRGFRGRLAIHEVIPADKFLPLIASDAPLAQLAALRDDERHPTLWQQGLAAAAQGLTTIEEVARVL